MFPLPWHPGPLAAKLRPGLAALFALRLVNRFAACKPGLQKKDLGTQREKAWPKTRDSSKKAVQEQMPSWKFKQGQDQITCPRRCLGKGRSLSKKHIWLPYTSP